jgi:CRP-like cAMP-binding protein
VSTTTVWRPVELARSRVTGHGNDLLAALPPAESMPLFDRVARAAVDAEVVLQEAGEAVRYAYFPVTCVVSLLVVLEDGRAIETATVGREGVVGLGVLLGDTRRGPVRATVQMGGELLRVDVDRFRAVATPGSKTDEILRRYVAARLFQVEQNVACGTAHRVRERLARWLLQTVDRSGSTDVRLTQAFLAEVLGVRRASVNEAVHELVSRGGLAPLRGGGVEIVDRALLERAACECYALVRAEHDRLLRWTEDRPTRV